MSFCLIFFGHIALNFCRFSFIFLQIFVKRQFSEINICLA